MKPMRNLILFLAFLAVCLCGTGCIASRATVKWTGREEVRFKNIEYALSPDKQELTLTYEREKKWYVIPLACFIFWRETPPALNSVQAFEKHISLDPLPDDLLKKHVDVTVDPKVQKKQIPSSWTEMPQFKEYFLQYVVRPNDPFKNFNTYEEFLKVWPQNLYRATVHPDELPDLSVPWVLHGPSPMIPFDREGDRYVFISPMENGWYGVDFPPMEDYSGYDRKEYLVMKADFFDWCWKVIWLPPGIVVDTLLLPITAPLYALSYSIDPPGKSFWGELKFWDNIYR